MKNLKKAFKNTSKITPLLTDLKKFLEKKGSETITRERGKTGFSNIVGQRILEKKSSFTMTLRRNQSFKSDNLSNSGESLKDTNAVDIKMINFGDNAELKEILKKFHDQDDKEGQNDKYV